MSFNFGAIDDLTAEARPERQDSGSPAHFNPDMRALEKRRWYSNRIKTRSYATMGEAPSCFNADADLRIPGHDCPEDKTDVVYAVGYRLCANGPVSFPDPKCLPPLTCLGPRCQSRSIERWDNDGIVNTASMAWPDGADTRLVKCDHMDVVGHFELVDAPDGTGRKYQAYDLLGSGSGFTRADFERVWSDIFSFCLETPGT
jgi:triacylglycerol lipase